MRYKELTEGRRSIEPSSYGYWIFADGEVVACDKESHASIVAAHNGNILWSPCDDDDEMEMVQSGFSDGGIRVVAQSGDSIFYAEWGFAASREAKNALIDVMRLYPGREYMVGERLVLTFNEAVRIIRA